NFTGARRSPLAAYRPPNPPPTITTLGREPSAAAAFLDGHIRPDRSSVRHVGAGGSWAARSSRPLQVRSVQRSPCGHESVQLPWEGTLGLIASADLLLRNGIGDRRALIDCAALPQRDAERIPSGSKMSEQSAREEHLALALRKIGGDLQLSSAVQVSH